MPLTTTDILEFFHDERDRLLAYDVDKADIVENAVLSYSASREVKDEDHVRKLIEFAEQYFDKFQYRMEHGHIWDLKKAPK